MTRRPDAAAPTRESAAYVLAGGRSRRFGADKARQDWHGRPMLAHVVSRLMPAFRTVCVVGGRAGGYADIVDVPELADRVPGCGPLSGVHAALLHAPSEWCFVAACDMPWVSPQVAAALRGCAREGDLAVVPEVDGRLIPTCAWYRRGALPALDAALAAGRHALQRVLRELPVSVVPASALRSADPHLKCLVNLNTLDDWRAAHGPFEPTA